MALAVCAGGAEGDTKKQIIDLFEFTEDSHAKNKALSTDLLEKKFKSITDLWLQQDFELKESFKEFVEKYYGTINSVDFSNTAVVVKIINDWCSEKTNGSIKQLVSEELINKHTALVITNAVYFKDQWDYSFDKAVKDVFYGKNRKDILMMSNRENYMYAEHEDCKCISLCYKAGLQMFIILPGDNVNFTDFQKGITKEKFRKLLIDRGLRKVTVKIPKFKLESGFTLSNTLKELGIRDAFDGDANFNGISNNKLFISEVIHKAYIDVTEEGTEASAATAVACMKCCYQPESLKQYYFIANRPFLFYIMDKEKILFSGRFEG